MWLRDKGRCVYCDTPLLVSRNIAYGFATIDHLLPRHSYKELENEVSNWVLSCRACNGAKRRWDPNGAAKVYKGESTLSDEQRAALIAAVKQRLSERDPHKEERFLKEREPIATEIGRSGMSVATAAQ